MFLSKRFDVTLPMTVDTDSLGSQPGHEGKARRPALGVVAVGALEEHSGLRELVDVGSDRSLVAVAAQHRAQVVDRDHEHIRFRSVGHAKRKDQRCPQKDDAGNG